MKKKLLLDGEQNKYRVKDVAIFDTPEKLKPLLNRLSWKILELLTEEAMYPIEIAKKLKVHEQKIYYHIRNLAKTGVITVVKEEERKGAIAKYYKAHFPAFGVELPYGYREIKTISVPSIDEKMKQFLNPFLENGVFNGKIVVGSPDPHGPFKTTARDGHYASYLTFFLGQFVSLPEDFVIKLDVDVKVEKEEENNMVLVGGPGTNLITQEINEHLPIRFQMMPSEHGFLLGGLVSEKTGNTYTADTIGVIAKIPNPWNNEKRIIVLAGNKAVGTKACVIAITKFWKESLKNYRNQEKFATIVRGFDLDGDGKVDSIEVLE